jgi:hypothetical protein
MGIWRWAAVRSDSTVTQNWEDVCQQTAISRVRDMNVRFGEGSFLWDHSERIIGVQNIRRYSCRNPLPTSNRSVQS